MMYVLLVPPGIERNVDAIAEVIGVIDVASEEWSFMNPILDGMQAEGWRVQAILPLGPVSALLAAVAFLADTAEYHRGHEYLSDFVAAHPHLNPMGSPN